jgi:glycolate oxidase iron-sulfur subunit
MRAATTAQQERWTTVMIAYENDAPVGTVDFSCREMKCILLADDRDYAVRAREWNRKLKDISEWLVEIGFRVPASEAAESQKVTYHEACHLCHGQKITKQPREILQAIPGVELTELPESNWCCGSAGVYKITQPETAAVLQERKVSKITTTGAAPGRW